MYQELKPSKRIDNIIDTFWTFSQNNESKQSENPFGIELVFSTSEVEKVMENAINNGAELLEKSVTKPWG